MGLQKSTAKYPINRLVTKVFTIPSGAFTVSKENVFLGQLPNRLTIGLVTNTAFNGSFTSHPFNFEHFNLNYICLHVGGRTIPAKPLRPDFKDSLYMRSYMNTLDTLGHLFEDGGNTISYEDFGRGFTLFCFDLTADQSSQASSYGQITQHGSLRLELQFSRALENTINILAHGEFQNLIEIDQHRNVICDFGV